MARWLDRAIEIGTLGGCGEIAAEILRRRPSGVPMVRYDRYGVAVHAAVRVNGVLLHFGDDAHLVEVSREEFNRAAEEDCYPDRVSPQPYEIAACADYLLSSR